MYTYSQKNKVYQITSDENYSEINNNLLLVLLTIKVF